MPRWMQNCGVSRLPLDFRDQYFGCEIELTGINRATAAQTLADLFGTRAEHSGGGYDAYRVKDLDGKEWKIVRDGSMGKSTTATAKAITLRYAPFQTRSAKSMGFPSLKHRNRCEESGNMKSGGLRKTTNPHGALPSGRMWIIDYHLKYSCRTTAKEKKPSYSRHIFTRL